MSDTNKNRIKVLIWISATLLVATAVLLGVFYSFQSKMEAEILRSSSANVSEGFFIVLTATDDVFLTKKVVDFYNAATPFNAKITNFKVRNPANAPDEWEVHHMNEFIADPELPSIYMEVEEEGEKLFRYMSPLKADVQCLTCHGGTLGETDTLGYAMEGAQLGDFIGAVSVKVPVGYVKPFTWFQDVMLTVCAVLVLFLVFFTGYLVRIKNIIE